MLILHGFVVSGIAIRGGIASIVPAMLNAIHITTGRRKRSLPIVSTA